MKYAYSSSLKILIAASKFSSSKYSNKDLYCPCCGEKVTFFNESHGLYGKQAHFRHNHGTYRSDCENYAIGVNTSYKPNKKLNEIIQGANAIYFEKRNDIYTFSYAIKFSDVEIDNYQNTNSYLHLNVINNGIKKEISIEIDHANFLGGKKNFIQLGDGGQKIIKLLDNETSQIDFINGITFFKIMGDGEWFDSNFIAKKVMNGDSGHRSKLFINEKYILVIPKHSVISNSLNVIKSEKYFFSNVDIYFIEFNRIDASIQDFCARGGYELCEKRNTLNILWPPCIEKEGTHFVKSDCVFLKTNFPLIYGESINIKNINSCDSYSCIIIDKEIIIDADNIHNEFKSCGSEQSVLIDYLPINIEKIESLEYKIDNEIACLVSPYGVNKLNKSQKVKLNLSREIRIYKSNYLVKVIICPKKEKEYKDIIKMAIWFNKKTKSFVPEKVLYEGDNPFVWDYLKQCRGTRKINESILKMLEGDKND